MNNPKDYLSSLIEKYGEPSASYMSGEGSDVWRQTMAATRWDDISGAEIVPLIGGGWEANIHFVNGAAIGSKCGKPLDSFSEAEKVLAHLAAMVLSAKETEYDPEVVVFRLNSIELLLRHEHLLSSERIEEAANFFGVSVYDSLEDVKAWAMQEFERIISINGDLLDALCLEDKARLQYAASYMIANNRYVHWTGSYQAERFAGRLAIPETELRRSST